MCKFLLGFLFFLFATAGSYSQNKTIGKGSYVSTRKGQTFKLNLLENNQFELTALFGEYEIKNDTLLLKSLKGKESSFSVTYSPEISTSDKIKVKLKGFSAAYYAASLYIGTQDGNLPVKYKGVFELTTPDDLAFETDEIAFEIDRSEYFYLVEEKLGEESSLSKYALPKSVLEMEIEYQPNAFADVKLKGYLKEGSNELVVSDDSGTNPLVFYPANQIINKNYAGVLPLEINKQTNWTYPEKQVAAADNAAADPVAVAPKFKFSIESNLKTALRATKKTPNRYLVVYSDPNNKNAKADFDRFIQDQQVELEYYFYDGYSPMYDLYNFYLATDIDKKWLKDNGVKDSPSFIVVNGDGVVLSKSKGSLELKKSLFSYYDTFYSNLKRVEILTNFKGIVSSKKRNDTEFLKGLAQISALDIPYLSGADATVYSADATLSETDETTVVADTDAVADPGLDYAPDENNFSKVQFDKKQVQAMWDGLIKSHQTDTNPNMDLVIVIVKEIKNIGFYKQLFGEEKLLNGTDLAAIDYLLKHFDVIEKERIKNNRLETPIHNLDDIGTEITNALQQNSTLILPETPLEYQKKVLAVNKELFSREKGNSNAIKNYFSLFKTIADKSDFEKEYVEEYDAFFKESFGGKMSIIESLDALFTNQEKSYQGYYPESWTDFKNYFSNLSNEVAWYVVTKSRNPESIRKAIRWSESSLVIEKDNPYYLDTLAQLYYKNGEKERAIATQEQALKFIESIDEETKLDIQEVLRKMNDGTY